MGQSCTILRLDVTDSVEVWWGDLAMSLLAWDLVEPDDLLSRERDGLSLAG